VRKRRLKRGRVDAGVVAKQKRVTFLPGEVFFFLTCPLMGDLTTICTGQASSMAALLLAAGSKGKRFALPHSRIMIHQPMGVTQGQATDIDIQAREIIRLKGPSMNFLPCTQARIEKRLGMIRKGIFS